MLGLGLALDLTAGRRSAAFAPAALFGAGDEGGAYDFTSLANLYQTTDTSTPVTAAGQPVGRVSDLSGKGRHLTQATSASRPLAQAGFIDFDGVDDGLSTGAITFGNDKMTAIAAVRFAGTAQMRLVNIAAGGGAGGMSVTSGNVLISDLGVTGTSQVYVSGPVAGADFTGTTLFDIAGVTATDEVKLRFNGTVPTQQINSPGPAGTGTWNTQGIAIGFNGFTANYLLGRVYRAICINRVLSGAELTAAEAWVAAGYGGTL